MPMIAPSRRQLLGLSAMAAVALCVPAQAEQPKLYDPMPPANSAYVRVIALSGGEYGVWVEQKERVSKVPSGTPSPYMVLPPGNQQIEVRSGGQTIAVAVNTQASRSFTVLLPEMKADKAVVVSDKNNSNRLKATLMAYNLGTQAADLSTADGQTTIFKNMAPGAGNGLVVNPVTLDYKATGSDGSTVGSGRVELTPGGAYTVVLTGASAGGPKAAAFTNSVERYLGN
jgi:alginate O-acetyltransferase complex protein AlgF